MFEKYPRLVIGEMANGKRLTTYMRVPEVHRALLALSRFDALREQTCAARTGGTGVSHGISERWSVSSVPGGTLAADSLVIPAGAAGSPVTIGFASGLPC